MNFALDDDQQLIVETVRKFAERDLRTWSADADRAGAPPDRLAHVAGELGFFVDAIPVSHDGMLEGAFSHTTRALRGFELGRGCAALAALLETNVEPALAVGTWGSAAAKSALFASLASGGLAALAHDSRDTLEISDAGGELRLSGKLGPVPALGTASHLLVISKGTTVLLETATLVRTAITPSGWRAARWGTVTLDAVKVPADFIVSRDPQVAAELLAWARVSLAARAAGVATVAMEHAEAYAKDRVQFGQPIGRFESLIRLRDDAETGALAAKTLALYAAWALDTKHPRAFEFASRARVLAGDVVAKATVDAVQIFGGYGFVNDYPVEKLMRDSRAFEALHGDERLGRVLAQKGVA
jgi:alkylation response protein AidB-like acyl-CoA dehydrogenase